MYESVIRLLGEMGYRTAPAEHYRMVDLWKEWYRGEVPSFHNYTVFNGIRHVRCRKKTASLAKKTAEDWADRLMNEKVRIRLDGGAEQAFFDAFCEKSRFRLQMNRWQELCFALGTCAYVVRLEGVAVDERGNRSGGEGELKLDCVPADGIFPLSWENREITECAFATERMTGGQNYVYLQIHVKGRDGCYEIRNRLFEENGGSLTETDLDASPLFAGVAPVFHTGSRHPYFVTDSPNIGNNFDPASPMGISVYANALDQLMVCDNIYDSLDNEFRLGRKRVMVKPEAVQNRDGEPLFDPNDLVFYILPEDGTPSSSVQEIQAKLRVQEHLTGLQTALSMLAVRCGFGPGHWRLDEGHLTTATEVISTNSDEYRTLKKHEIVLEQALIQLTRTLLRAGRQFLGLELDENVRITVDFDDSIIEDTDTQFERDCRMLQLGVMEKEEFRAKWRN